MVLFPIAYGISFRRPASNSGHLAPAELASRKIIDLDVNFFYPKFLLGKGGTALVFEENPFKDAHFRPVNPKYFFGSI